MAEREAGSLKITFLLLVVGVSGAEGWMLTGEPLPAEGVTTTLVAAAVIVPVGYPVPAIVILAPTSTGLAGDVRITCPAPPTISDAVLLTEPATGV